MAVVVAPPVGALGEAKLDQGRVEQIAGIVSGERSPGLVRALETGGEADDQQAGVAVAEAWHRCVMKIRVPRAVLVTERAETRAEPAIGPRFVNLQLARPGQGHGPKG